MRSSSVEMSPVGKREIVRLLIDGLRRGGFVSWLCDVVGVGRCLQLRDRLWLELSIAYRAQNAQKDGQNKACHVDLDL